MVSILLSAAFFTCRAADSRTVPLWPDGAPGARGTQADEVVTQRGTAVSDRIIRNVHVPTLEVFLPERAPAPCAAVVICPGGGYGVLAYDKEGVEVAKWLNSLGMAGFVLKYRLKEYGHPAPLRDLQRALRLVRAGATTWRVDPHRVGICGFSAGGHLVTTGATHFDAGTKDAADPVDREGCRPDFLIAIYPVVSMRDGTTHGGSRRNLLGPDPDPKLVQSLSNETQVTPQTPPTFLVHATDDRAVKVENSINFYLAARRAGVPAAMHIYQSGGHGFGMRSGCFAGTDWPGRCAAWLRENGMTGKAGE